MSVIIPPIKSQGIKTKLVPWINDLIYRSGEKLSGNWIEPFFGTGVVGLNSPLKGEHIVDDTNPHIINFYRGIKDGSIDEYKMRSFLEREGKILSMADSDGYAYYKEVRNRFNREHSPYDFIFLSRAGFNGIQIPFDMRSVIPAICGHSFFKYFYGCKVNVLNRYLGRQTVFFC